MLNVATNYNVEKQQREIIFNSGMKNYLVVLEDYDCNTQADLGTIWNHLRDLEGYTRIV